MVSREHKKAALHEKLQLLRSVTNSHAKEDTSIISDASKYIEELKRKIDILNKDIAQSSSYQNSWPMVHRFIGKKRKNISLDNPIVELVDVNGVYEDPLVKLIDVNSVYVERLIQVTVEALEKGIQVNVYSERSCQGLLVFVLKAFEDLSLNVLEARVSCTACFQLEALGVESEENGEAIDTHTVKQAILQAIEDWMESSDQDY